MKVQREHAVAAGLAATVVVVVGFASGIGMVNPTGGASQSGTTPGQPPRAAQPTAPTIAPGQQPPVRPNVVVEPPTRQVAQPAPPPVLTATYPVPGGAPTGTGPTNAVPPSPTTGTTPPTGAPTGTPPPPPSCDPGVLGSLLHQVGALTGTLPVLGDVTSLGGATAGLGVLGDVPGLAGHTGSLPLAGDLGGLTSLLSGLTGGLPLVGGLLGGTAGPGAVGGVASLPAGLLTSLLGQHCGLVVDPRSGQATALLHPGVGS
ncbi:hypothetical protein F0L68_36580 [Solihabitans fulvus]|uniref:Uncharacterized protein n=1 Tax=Solihabitans fulvus TaxID=1892852 RepID=A0A5B2WNL1_9PSEU|nr:hypothetical protein [Solihabitans fulvus]KAA2252252.1 hypothetical protein F0L68_36580 [Solihabitans fulvus]